MLRARWFVGMFFLLPVSGCHPIQRIPFDSPDIFRGTYEGEIDQRLSSSDVAWTADGSLLVMASGNRQAALQFWDPVTGTPTDILGPDSDGYEAAMTPDGRFVALASSSRQEAGRPVGAVRVWDTETGEVVHRFPGRTPDCQGCEPLSLALSPDGRLLALISSADDPTLDETPWYPLNELSVFDLATGGRLHTVSGLYAGGLTVSFSPDGSQLAALGDTYDAEQDLRLATAWLWEMPSGEALGTYHQSTSNGLKLLNAGVWREGPVVGLIVEGRINVIDMVSGTLLRSLVRPLRPSEWVEGLALSADLERALVSYVNSTSWGQLSSETVLWQRETPVAAATTDDHEVAVGFSPNSAYAVTWSKEGLTLRDPETLDVQRRLVSAEVVPIRLEVTPTYRSTSRYDVEGTFQFAQDEPVTLTGSVEGGAGEVYVQWSPPTPAFLDFTFDVRGELWGFQGWHGYGEKGKVWEGRLFELNDGGLWGWTYELRLDPVR